MNPDLETGIWPTSLPVCFPVSNMAEVTPQEVGVCLSSPSCLTEAEINPTSVDEVLAVGPQRRLGGGML